LGNKESIFESSWPEVDPRMLVEDKVTIVIQVNGKVRSKIAVAADIAEARLKEIVLADQGLVPWIQGKPVKKFIIVPQKLVNIVV